jgi:hypothetical protein
MRMQQISHQIFRLLTLGLSGFAAFILPLNLIGADTGGLLLKSGYGSGGVVRAMSTLFTGAGEHKFSRGGRGVVAAALGTIEGKQDRGPTLLAPDAEVPARIRLRPLGESVHFMDTFSYFSIKHSSSFMTDTCLLLQVIGPRVKDQNRQH